MVLFWADIKAKNLGVLSIAASSPDAKVVFSWIDQGQKPFHNPPQPFMTDIQICGGRWRRHNHRGGA